MDRPGASQRASHFATLVERGATVERAQALLAYIDTLADEPPPATGLMNLLPSSFIDYAGGDDATS